MGSQPSPSESTRGAAPNIHGLTNGKTGAAPPKVTGDGTLELENMEGAAETKLPLHEDIMQLARLGEVGPVQKLFEEGKYDANYKDAEGITPLHVCRCDNPISGTWLTSDDSGQRSIITTRFANTW